MKLSEWAKQNNINYITAWRRWKNDKLPEGVVARQTNSGAILIETSKVKKVKNDITNAIKSIYPEEISEIIDEDLEIKDLIAKLERKIEQRMRGDEIDTIKEDISDLKEMVSNLVYSLEKNSVEKEEIDEAFGTTETSIVAKNNISRKEELSSKLTSGELPFRRRPAKTEIPPQKDIDAAVYVDVNSGKFRLEADMVDNLDKKKKLSSKLATGKLSFRRLPAKKKS